MLTRMRRGAGMTVLLFCAVSAPSNAQGPGSYRRAGTLPAMIVGRAELERLMVEIADSVYGLTDADTISGGARMLSLVARIPTGRAVGVNDSTMQILDTVRTYLGAKSDLEMVSFHLNDTRSFRDRGTLARHPRIFEAGVGLAASADSRKSGYSVIGFDTARVDQIANRIEAFGKTHETRWGPEFVDRARAGVKVLALLLVVIAVALRRHRAMVLVYPISAALFVASYLYPFAAVFNNLVVNGSR
jgi:hypothetical protein